MRLARSLFWSLLLPAGATLLIMRFLVPGPMEGRSGGLAAVAWFADQFPVVVALALFIATAQAINYWRARVRPPVPAPGLTPARSGRWSTARIAASLALAVAAALALRHSVVETYRVMSPSMLPTLEVGDRLLVDKRAYGLRPPFASTAVAALRLPRRGDVVAFRSSDAPTGERGAPRMLVKRVLGLPGDRIGFDGGHLVINGWGVPTCDAGPFVAVVGRLTVRGRLGVETLDGRTYLTVWNPGEPPSEAFVVPPGQVFVVGDDRGFSSDSRVWNDRHGAGVPVGALVGRVTRILAGTRGDDGRVDLGRLLAPLGVDVRQPGVDLADTRKRIDACVKRPLPSTTPPLAALAAPSDG